MSSTRKPIIALTMGEPAGIGPEICAKVLTDAKLYEFCRPLLLGSTAIIADALKLIGKTKETTLISHASSALPNFTRLLYSPKELQIIDFDNFASRSLQPATDTQAGGKASGEYIEKSIQLALEQKIHGVVTAPISKVSFQLGGWGLKYRGHTEMFADLTHSEKYSMMLAHGNLRVVHVTTHLALRQALEAITLENVLTTIELADQTCRSLGIASPKIAVCGLNPHAGEDGLMGREEIEEIEPAIREAQQQGIRAEGPFPSDTIWPKIVSNFYDIGVAMYHDQGGIPVKLLGFQHRKEAHFQEIHGINVTVGIPIIRVSVDHGTAYDIAWKGVATPSSLFEAFEIASQLAEQKFFS